VTYGGFAASMRNEQARAGTHKVRELATGWVTLTISVPIGIVMLAAIAWVSASGFGLFASTSGEVANVVAVQTGGSAAQSGAESLTLADLDALTRTTRPDVPLTSRVVSGAEALVTDEAPHVHVVGVDESYAQIWSDTLSRGTFFSAQDALAANRVAVLGEAASGGLFPDTQQTAVGKTIFIHRLPFTVIGVLSTQLSAADVNPNNAVLVPFQTGQIRLFGTQSSFELLLRVRDRTRASAVSDQVRQLLRQRHRLTSGQPDTFTIRTESISATDGRQTPLEIAVRVFRLTLQFTCQAKGLCGRPLTANVAAG
jgi:putative ABC transport system permease protein